MKPLTMNQIKLSKKAAIALGESFAVSLHAYTAPAQRGAVIDSFNNFVDELAYECGAVVKKAYYAKLDELEPLPSSKRADTFATLGF